jgi:ADP-heptose:LPS heptosyltransferase
MWPVASFARVAEHLEARYQLRAVVIAGPGQEAIAGDVARLCSATDLTGLSLEELAALMADSTMFIGNDSGPMHIAAALERPLVAIFGDSNPTVWSPWTTAPKRVLIAPENKVEDRSAAGWQGSSHEPVTRRISQISVDEVIAAVDEIMVAQAAQPLGPAAASQ